MMPPKLLIKNICIKLNVPVIYHRISESFSNPFFSYSSERNSFILNDGEFREVFEYSPTKLIKYNNR